jgi:hypothetical protein
MNTYNHKHIETMTFATLEEVRHGWKGLQKDKNSLSKLERTKGRISYYSHQEIAEFFTLQKTKIEIEYVGVDYWSRPIWKSAKNLYYGSTDVLLPSKRVSPNNTTEEINDYFRDNMVHICYFGRTFGCEPNGGLSNDIELVII